VASCYLAYLDQLLFGFVHGAIYTICQKSTSSSVSGYHQIRAKKIAQRKFTNEISGKERTLIESELFRKLGQIESVFLNAYSQLIKGQERTRRIQKLSNSLCVQAQKYLNVVQVLKVSELQIREFFCFCTG